MDTSETYILQCQKATEIQEAWKPRKADVVKVLQEVVWDGYHHCADAGEITTLLGLDDEELPLVGDASDVAFYSEGPWKGFNSTPVSNLVFLPRQDQLQAMVEKRNTRELLMRFADWVEKETNYRRESMEQLWLSYVMWTKYGKQWSGSDWTK